MCHWYTVPLLSAGCWSCLLCIGKVARRCRLRSGFTGLWTTIDGILLGSMG